MPTANLEWPAGWPRTDPAKRQRARFGSRNEQGYGNRQVTVSQAIRRLHGEVSRYTRTGRSWVIPPDTVVISTDMPMRLDGLPRSGAKEPDDPGVAVYFTYRGKPRVLACDQWDRVADNIVAIAKTLEALRALDRWGVTDMLSRVFQGFAALPSPDQVSAACCDWRSVLGVPDCQDVGVARKAYRLLAGQHHPDRDGGDAERFNRIAKAWDQAQKELG